MKLRHSVVCAVMAFWWSASAQATDSKLCKQPLTNPTYLQSIGQDAAKAKKEICSAESQIEMNLAYVDFLNSISGWFDPYGGFEGGGSVVDAIKKNISIANTSVTVTLSLVDKLQVELDSFKPNDEIKCTKISGAPSCVELLEEFVQLHADIHNLQTEYERIAILKKLKILRAEWKPFLEHMKAQTWLELLVNRQAYRNESDTFSAPPSSQWIVLHPTVLIENVAAAADGENTQEALGIEVFGMNWWKQDKWYVPSGISALAVYSDRSNINDMGYGLALHFLSSYTIGYTNHGGEDGLTVSVDLIKIFQDKNKAFESYRSAFE
jgi:hypothetical protein